MSLESWKEMVETEAKHTPLVGATFNTHNIQFQSWCSVEMRVAVAQHILNSQAWSYAYTDEIFALTVIDGRKVVTYLYWKDGRTEELQ